MILTGLRSIFKVKRMATKIVLATLLTCGVGTVGTSSFFQFAHAATATKYTVNASALHVRSGASTRYRILGLVRRGQSLSVKKRLSNGWYQISYKGHTGYVSGKYIKKSTLKSIFGVAHAATLPTKTVTRYTVTVSTLNVRSGASTRYHVIGKVHRGQALSVKRRLSNGWYQISLNRHMGYVSGSYVKASKVTTTFTPSNKVAPKPTASKVVAKTQTAAATILNVPLIRQRPALPSGCEANALDMALAYYHVNVKNTTLANEMPRDNSRLVRNSNGSIRVWGDPEVGFVGNPYGLGITINPNPLKKVLDRYRPGGIALYGQDFSVVQNYVSQGKPTLVWFTINHRMPLARYWKTPQGKTIYAPHPLHCIVVTGVDSNYVYFNDGESTSVSGQNVRMPKSSFIAIYNAMGKRALVVN